MNFSGAKVKRKPRQSRDLKRGGSLSVERTFLPGRSRDGLVHIGDLLGFKGLQGLLEIIAEVLLVGGDPRGRLGRRRQAGGQLLLQVQVREQTSLKVLRQNLLRFQVFAGEVSVTCGGQRNEPSVSRLALTSDIISLKNSLL